MIAAILVGAVAGFFGPDLVVTRLDFSQDRRA
jgi:hypothetical protein